MDCTNGKSASIVEWTFKQEAPEAESICFEVTAKEKISMECAAPGVQNGFLN
jgi:hypothetical protein